MDSQTEHRTEKPGPTGPGSESRLPSGIQVVGAAVLDSLVRPSKLLAARRSAPEALAGLWEFPGGKVEPLEDCVQALHRELAEELGIRVRMGAEIPGPLEQGWQLNSSAAMRVWMAEVAAGVPEPLEDHDELRWVDLTEEALMGLPWIPADLPIVAALLAAAAAPRNAALQD